MTGQPCGSRRNAVLPQLGRFKKCANMGGVSTVLSTWVHERHFSCCRWTMCHYGNLVKKQVRLSLSLVCFHFRFSAEDVSRFGCPYFRLDVCAAAAGDKLQLFSQLGWREMVCRCLSTGSRLITTANIFSCGLKFDSCQCAEEKVPHY